MDKLQIGTVLSKSGGEFMKNFVPIAIVSMLLLAVPTLLLQQFVIGPQTAKMQAAILAGNTSAVLLPTVLGLLPIIFQLLLMSAITYCVVQSQAGREVSVGDMFSNGLSALAATLGITLIFFLVMIPSAFLLFIPVIVIGCIWWVAVPVAVAEKSGVLGALARSRALTKGNRWTIFGLMLLYIVAAMAIGVISLLMMAGAGGLNLASLTKMSQTLASEGITVSLILSQILGALLYAFIAVVVAVCYTELRRIKEGASISEVSQIFA
jgi:hypothetical protein